MSGNGFIKFEKNEEEKLSSWKLCHNKNFFFTLKRKPVCPTWGLELPQNIWIQFLI